MLVPYQESFLESFQQAFLTQSLSTLAVLESRDGKKKEEETVVCRWHAVENWVMVYYFYCYMGGAPERQHGELCLHAIRNVEKRE